MAKKNYSKEFRRNAVELYRVTKGATVAGSPPLSASRTAPCPRGSTPRASPSVDPAHRCHRRDHVKRRSSKQPDCGPEVHQLRAEKTKLETERDILRPAAKYFTAETN